MVVAIPSFTISYALVSLQLSLTQACSNLLTPHSWGDKLKEGVDAWTKLGTAQPTVEHQVAPAVDFPQVRDVPVENPHLVAFGVPPSLLGQGFIWGEGGGHSSLL